MDLYLVMCMQNIFKSSICAWLLFLLIYYLHKFFCFLFQTRRKENILFLQYYAMLLAWLPFCCDTDRWERQCDIASMLLKLTRAGGKQRGWAARYELGRGGGKDKGKGASNRGVATSVLH